jgi:RNA polymerase sigma factor (sigma-70 family)
MSNSEKLSESELIERICAGKTQLYKVLIRKANSLLYKTGRSYGYNHQDTQDLMQDAFIDAYLNLSAFQKKSTFRTWVMKIMLNKCYQKTRRFSFRNEIPDDNNIINDHSTPIYSNSKSSDVNNLYMNKELSRVIEDALMHLSLEYRLVFLFREINGLTVSETAEALDISEANVKVRLNRAKVMMKKEIEKSYSKEEIFEFNLLYCDIMVNSVMSRIEQLKNTSDHN